MGSSLSTLMIDNALSMLKILSQDTLIGMILALPFFVTYFNEALEKNHAIIIHDNNNKTMPNCIVVSSNQEEEETTTNTSCCSSISKLTTIIPNESSSSTTAPLQQENSPSFSFSSSSSSSSSFYQEMPSMSECWEMLCQNLIDKAKCASSSASSSSNHYRITLANALVELGTILFQQYYRQQKELQHNDDDESRPLLKQSVRVLKHAETIQRNLIQETIQSVANAMKEQSQYYSSSSNNKNASLWAKLYLDTANQLESYPTANNLGRAFQIHSQNKKSSMMPKKGIDVEQQQLSRKVQRRLKRASQQALPLAHTLKLLAQTKQEVGKEQYATTSSLKRSNYR